MKQLGCYLHTGLVEVTDYIPLGFAGVLSQHGDISGHIRQVANLVEDPSGQIMLKSK